MMISYTAAREGLEGLEMVEIKKQPSYHERQKKRQRRGSIARKKRRL